LYQEFVNGTPHSASFLIDRTGCVVAVGVARQHVDRANGNFVYRGGCAPAGDPSWCAEMARSLAQIEGLQGWVGVDFVATDTGATVFLEINPRLTTSFVGFQQVAGVGAIARVWWQGIERGFGSDAHELAARIAVAPPCTFTTMNSTERSAHANI
jgi:predicted ATP-grasp superfamily ATP-dependent carboligase